MRAGLIALLALSACTSAEPAAEPTAAADPDAAAAAAARTGGWARMFAEPEQVVAAANQFGFVASPYAKASDGWRSTGQPVFVSGSAAEHPNQARFTAMGRRAEQLDTIVLTLDLTDGDNAAAAKAQFFKVLRDLLWQFDAPGAALIEQPIARETPVSATQRGVTYAVTRDPLAESGPGARRLTVTFSRPTAIGTQTQSRNA